MISTTCKDCIFKKMDNGEQSDCSLGILDLFDQIGAEITKHSDGGPFYRINRICMWRRSDPGYDSSNIEKDVYVRSNIVIMHTEGDNLSQTLDDVYNLDTLRKPRVIVCHTTKDLLEIYGQWSPKFGEDKFSCVQIVESTYDRSAYDEAFKRTKNGWIFFIKSGDRVDKDMVNALNYSVNHKMGKHIATTGVRCYMSVVYKYLKGHLGNIDDVISGIDGAVVEWGQIYDDYRLYSRNRAAQKQSIR